MDRACGYSETVCRLCLMEDGIMVHLFRAHEHLREPLTWPEKIMTCADVEVSPGDGLPDHICHRCIVQLDNCLDFKEKCEASDEKLRTRLGRPPAMFEIQKVYVKPEPYRLAHSLELSQCDENSPLNNDTDNDEGSYLSDASLLDDAADALFKSESIDFDADYDSDEEMDCPLNMFTSTAVVRGTEHDEVIEKTLQAVVRVTEHDEDIEKTLQAVVRGTEDDDVMEKTLQAVVRGTEDDEVIEKTLQAVVRGTEDDDVMEKTLQAVVRGTEDDEVIEKTLQAVVRGTEDDDVMEKTLQAVVRGTEDHDVIEKTLQAVVRGTEDHDVIEKTLQAVVRDNENHDVTPAAEKTKTLLLTTDTFYRKRMQPVVKLIPLDEATIEMYRRKGGGGDATRGGEGKRVQENVFDREGGGMAEKRRGKSGSNGRPRTVQENVFDIEGGGGMGEKRRGKSGSNGRPCTVEENVFDVEDGGIAEKRREEWPIRDKRPRGRQKTKNVRRRNKVGKPEEVARQNFGLDTNCTREEISDRLWKEFTSGKNVVDNFKICVNFSDGIEDNVCETERCNSNDNRQLGEEENTNVEGSNNIIGDEFNTSCSNSDGGAARVCLSNESVEETISRCKEKDNLPSNSDGGLTSKNNNKECHISKMVLTMNTVASISRNVFENVCGDVEASCDVIHNGLEAIDNENVDKEVVEESVDVVDDSLVVLGCENVDRERIVQNVTKVNEPERIIESVISNKLDKTVCINGSTHVEGERTDGNVLKHDNIARSLLEPSCLMETNRKDGNDMNILRNEAISEETPPVYKEVGDIGRQMDARTKMAEIDGTIATILRAQEEEWARNVKEYVRQEAEKSALRSVKENYSNNENDDISIIDLCESENVKDIDADFLSDIKSEHDADSLESNRTNKITEKSSEKVMVCILKNRLNTNPCPLAGTETFTDNALKNINIPNSRESISIRTEEDSPLADLVFNPEQGTNDTNHSPRDVLETCTSSVDSRKDGLTDVPEPILLNTLDSISFQSTGEVLETRTLKDCEESLIKQPFIQSKILSNTEGLMNCIPSKILSRRVSYESISSTDPDVLSVSSLTVGSVQSIGDCKTVIFTSISKDTREAVFTLDGEGGEPPSLMDKRIGDWVTAATAANRCTCSSRHRLLSEDITTVHIETDERDDTGVFMSGFEEIGGSGGERCTRASCVSARVLPFELARSLAKVSSELLCRDSNDGDDAFETRKKMFKSDREKRPVDIDFENGTERFRNGKSSPKSDCRDVGLALIGSREGVHVLDSPTTGNNRVNHPKTADDINKNEVCVVSNGVRNQHVDCHAQVESIEIVAQETAIVSSTQCEIENQNNVDVIENNNATSVKKVVDSVSSSRKGDRNTVGKLERRKVVSESDITSTNVDTIIDLVNDEDDDDDSWLIKVQENIRDTRKQQNNKSVDDEADHFVAYEYLGKHVLEGKENCGATRRNHETTSTTKDDDVFVLRHVRHRHVQCAGSDVREVASHTDDSGSRRTNTGCGEPEECSSPPVVNVEIEVDTTGKTVKQEPTKVAVTTLAESNDETIADLEPNETNDVEEIQENSFPTRSLKRSTDKPTYETNELEDIDTVSSKTYFSKQPFVKIVSNINILPTNHVPADVEVNSHTTISRKQPAPRTHSNTKNSQAEDNQEISRSNFSLSAENFVSKINTLLANRMKAMERNSFQTVETANTLTSNMNTPQTNRVKDIEASSLPALSLKPAAAKLASSLNIPQTNCVENNQTNSLPTHVKQPDSRTTSKTNIPHAHTSSLPTLSLKRAAETIAPSLNSSSQVTSCPLPAKKPRLSHLEALRAKWFTSDIATRQFSRRQVGTEKNPPDVQLSREEEIEMARRQLEDLYEPYNGGGCKYPPEKFTPKKVDPVVRFFMKGSLESKASNKDLLITSRVAAAIKKFLSRDVTEVIVPSAPSEIQETEQRSGRAQRTTKEKPDRTKVRINNVTATQHRNGSIDELPTTLGCNESVNTHRSTSIDTNTEKNPTILDSEGQLDRETLVKRRTSDTKHGRKESRKKRVSVSAKSSSTGHENDVPKSIRVNDDRLKQRTKILKSTASQTTWKPSLLPALLETTPVGIVNSLLTMERDTATSAEHDPVTWDVRVNEKQTQTINKLEWRPPLVNARLQKYSIPKKGAKPPTLVCFKTPTGAPEKRANSPTREASTAIPRKGAKPPVLTCFHTPSSVPERGAKCTTLESSTIVPRKGAKPATGVAFESSAVMSKKVTNTVKTVGSESPSGLPRKRAKSTTNVPFESPSGHFTEVNNQVNNTLDRKIYSDRKRKKHR